jgi:hypothetical protein
MTIDNDKVQQLWDREQIRQVIYRERRGADRADAELRKTCFHADAVVNNGLFSGPASEYIAWAMTDDNPSFQITTHLVGNILIELDGDEARSESYLLAVHVGHDASGEYHDLMGTRYFDRHRRDDGDWKIVDRLVIIDWKLRQRTDTAVPDFGANVEFTHGVRGSADVTVQAGFATRFPVTSA